MPSSQLPHIPADERYRDWKLRSLMNIWLQKLQVINTSEPSTAISELINEMKQTMREHWHTEQTYKEQELDYFINNIGKFPHANRTFIMQELEELKRELQEEKA